MHVFIALKTLHAASKIWMCFKDIKKCWRLMEWGIAAALLQHLHVRIVSETD